ncbi:MAG: DNA replication/repair protein RecF, partial [Clostridiales bacterium]|nr:DNA replication/repair protein RecF [Clostridiales bacterium]
MFLESVKAKDFRNLNGGTKETGLGLELSRGVNILTGMNAQGKTNFIEAVYFCATARSHRTANHGELIRFGEDAALISINVSRGVDGRYKDRIEMSLKRTGKNAVVKSARVNGVPIDKLGDLLGILYCVIFSPENLSLVKSGPGERRRFMDMELCQVSKVYYYELKQYYHILRQRNALLKGMQKGAGAGDTLELWDAQLAESGGRIVSLRRAYIESISRVAAGIHQRICGEEFSAVYRPSVTAGEFLDKLKKNRETDIRNGSTGCGVHKDDVQFIINGLDSRVYGSQGQQRTTALSLKLAEVIMIREEKGETPLLLLDDVMSELDAARQEHLLSAISGAQTIITCT